jgi:hypothetical protein
MCQRHTGALAIAWAEFAAENIRWTGTGGVPSVYRSSAFSSRAFCSICGSSIGAIDDKPVIALLLGVFDSNNRKELIPQYHSFRSGRPKWWRIEITCE